MSPRPDAAPAATVLRLALGEAVTVLWLHPDPEGRRPALARAAGHAITYDGRLPDGALGALLLDLGRRLGAGAPGAGTGADAVARLAGVLRALDPAASLTPLRTVPPGQRVPAWPLRRDGPFPEAGPQIWPFDPEVAGIRAGTRRLIKRELPRGAGAEAGAGIEAAELTAAGLEVRRVARPEGVVLLAAADPGVLDDAVAFEHALGGKGPEAEAAVRHLGDALGYPPCCVAALGGHGRHDDLSLAVTCLPPLGTPPAPPETQWLLGPVAIASHVPCSLHCAATARMVGAVLEALEAEHPGFVARWRDLARAVHLVTGDGRAVSLQVTGDALAGARITRAVELVPPAGAPPYELLRPLPDLAGARLEVGEGGLALVGPAPVASHLVADHRG